jgi:hypothetical protein
MADNMRVTQLNVSAISEDRLPELFTLEQNYPNPFNPSTSIPFALPTSSRVSLTVYNMLGQRVLTLVDEVKPAGVYEVKFNAVKLSSGMYVYRIQAGDFVAIKKLIFLK